MNPGVGMTWSSKPWRVSAAMIAVVLVSGTAFAQQAGVDPVRGRGGRMAGGPAAMLPLRQLDLTDAQRTQVQQLVERHRAEVRPLVERLRTATETQRQAMEVVPADEGRIRTAMEQLAQVQADLAVQRARLHSEIVALLTPEQQQRLAQLRAEGAARMQQRRERLQQRQPA